MRAVTLTILAITLLTVLACDKGTDSDGDNNLIQKQAWVFGTISDYYDNSHINNAEVEISGTSNQTALTDENGFYSFDQSVPSGACTLSVSIPGYAVTNTELFVPDYGSVRADLPTAVLEDFELDLRIYPLTGQLSGIMPAAAFDVPDFPGVPVFYYARVYLHFEGKNHLGVDHVWIEPSVFYVETDARGDFSFSYVPLTDSALLTTPPYIRRDSVVLATSQTVPVMQLPHDSLISVMAEVVAYECPTPSVVATSLPETGCVDHDAEISIEFSDSMYISDDFAVILAPAGGVEEPATLSWNDAQTVVTIVPVLGLLTDAVYTIDLEGNNWCGAAIGGSENTHWSFSTCDGIALDSVIAEPWSDDIIMATLCFNRPPSLEPDSAYVRLLEETTGRYLRLDISIDGSDIMISPRTELDPGMSLWLEYRVYSDIPRDSDSGSIQITTGM